MKKTMMIAVVAGLMTTSYYANAGAQAPAQGPAAGAAAGAAGGALAAPAMTRTVNEGIYTAEQATRGAALYKEQCAACHGADLAGMGPMPPLAGAAFMKNWDGKSVGALFDKIHTTMPITAPGSLKEPQTTDIVAHMLSALKYPAGTTPLDGKKDTMLQIKIEPVK